MNDDDDDLGGEASDEIFARRGARLALGTPPRCRKKTRETAAETTAIILARLPTFVQAHGARARERPRASRRHVPPAPAHEAPTIGRRREADPPRGPRRGARRRVGVRGRARGATRDRGRGEIRGRALIARPPRRLRLGRARAPRRRGSRLVLARVARMSRARRRNARARRGAARSRESSRGVSLRRRGLRHLPGSNEARGRARVPRARPSDVRARLTRGLRARTARVPRGRPRVGAGSVRERRVDGGGVTTRDRTEAMALGRRRGGGRYARERRRRVLQDRGREVPDARRRARRKPRPRSASLRRVSVIPTPRRDLHGRRGGRSRLHHRTSPHRARRVHPRGPRVRARRGARTRGVAAVPARQRDASGDAAKSRAVRARRRRRGRDRLRRMALRERIRDGRGDERYDARDRELYRADGEAPSRARRHRRHRASTPRGVARGRETDTDSFRRRRRAGERSAVARRERTAGVAALFRGGRRRARYRRLRFRLGL